MMIRTRAVQTYNALLEAGYALDPLTILAIVTALSAILKACSATPASALARVKNLKLLDRVRLRKIIREHGIAEEDVGAVAAAVRDMGATLGVGDVVTMFDELEVNMATKAKCMQAGIPADLVQLAEEKGMDWGALLQLFLTYGPELVKILLALFGKQPIGPTLPTLQAKPVAP